MSASKRSYYQDYQLKSIYYHCNNFDVPAIYKD